MAMDVAAYNIQHVKLDPTTKRFMEVMKTGLNNCLTVEANVDQTGKAFLQDAVMSMFDEGYVALVPVETDLNPINTGSWDILSLRTGRIISWFPRHILVEVYNDRTGQRESITLPKNVVAIVENPLYAVMNEPNSTMKRLMRKLVLLDAVDEQSSSGKLDLIIQLPYVIKTELKQKQANERRKAIEEQLKGSQYGIAYIDGTEHITQLNRPSENNLLAQVTYLTNMLYSQLGVSEAVFNGTADERQMLNYYNRTVEPIAKAMMDEMTRKFITKTGRTQGQIVMGFHDAFHLIPAQEMAEIADVFTRNEILSSNEVRAILGMKPAEDPAADELRNKNMPVDATGQNGTDPNAETEPSLPYSQVQQIMADMAAEYDAAMKESLDAIQKDVDTLTADLPLEDETPPEPEEKPKKEEA